MRRRRGVTAVHIALGVLILGVFAAAAALGAWRWWEVEPSDWFWRLLRFGQVLVVVEALFGGILLAMGRSSSRQLHLLYGLLPIVVSFVAEQLRIASAESVLEARGVPDTAAMRRLPDPEQDSIVLAIIRRELGVMTIAALVILGLVARAGFV
jgi:hypothetical protein